MADPIKLALAKSAQDSAAIVPVIFEEAVARHREIIKEHPDSGFVMLTYRRPSKGQLTSIIDYFLHDPMDAYPLPEFVAERIKNLRDST